MFMSTESSQFCETDFRGNTSVFVTATPRVNEFKCYMKQGEEISETWYRR